MHSVSASSRGSVTQPDNKLNWSNQLGKSVVLTVSSVGLGWLISRLWQGTNEPLISLTENNGQLTIYKRIQDSSRWSNAESLSIESSEIFEHGLQSESSFDKVDIVYKSSVQEPARNPALDVENANLHVLLAGSLAGGLLVGGNIQFPLMVPFLAFSMSKGVEASNYVDDNPVGTIIASVSKELPEGYLRCDGSLHSKNEYLELYRAIGGEYGEDGGSFRVPNFGGLFLRGTNDVFEIGKFFEDTTKMPRQPFRLLNSGIHAHSASSAGEHKHESNSAGKHTHTVTAAGKHTHSVTSAGEHLHGIHDSGSHVHAIRDSGEHLHGIQDSGNHNHGMDVAGKHDHCSREAKYLLKRTGQWTMNSWDSDSSKYEPNLRDTEEIPWDGEHSHHIHHNGVHSHKMDKGGNHKHEMEQTGVHSHGMNNAGVHMHAIGSEADHAHTMSSEGPHSHIISLDGKHTHNLAEAGGHVHEMIGGDEETSPKNVKVAYLIKAKRSENSSPVAPTNNYFTPQSAAMSLVTAVFGFYIARIRG